MFENLKSYCKSVIPFTNEELNLIDNLFKILTLKKKDYLLQEGKICNFIGYISQGSIRHFHIKNGYEKTCELSFENSWITDLSSFSNKTSCIMNLQAMENTTIALITKENLQKLYKSNPKFETFGRIMAEKVAQRATEIAMSLSSEKPEERFQNLISTQPDIFQRVPQKYIANFLGVSPESLSRIRNRILNKLKS